MSYNIQHSAADHSKRSFNKMTASLTLFNLATQQKLGLHDDVELAVLQKKSIEVSLPYS